MVKILLASHEVAPLAKVGGLADVAGSLPSALVERGHDVRVVMPAYRMVLDDPAYKVERVVDDFPVYVGPGWTVLASLWQTTVAGTHILLIGGDPRFEFATESAAVYQPGFEQHLFFARAVLEACNRMDWKPDVVHANDWHTGFLPVFMRTDDGWEDVASVFTIHNLAYQGEFGPEVLDRAGLPRRMFNHHELEAYGSVNFLKAGCVFADRVNTVSERYSHEIQEPEFGCRLDGLMRHLAANGRLSGILNGIDQREFNPSGDGNLLARYSASELSGKTVCKRSLLHDVGFPGDSGMPLFGVVSRLSSQKGMDLILEVADKLMDLPALLVIQGLGDPSLAARFRELEARRPERFRFVERFDADFAQRVYAGSDMFLMPSAFEPCGLGQMIAMRYGTVPIVRETGGLADTVHEFENGFTFSNSTGAALLRACERAFALYREPLEWRMLVDRAMSYDSSWTQSAGKYEALYAEALGTRRQAPAEEPLEESLEEPVVEDEALLEAS